MASAAPCVWLWRVRGDKTFVRTRDLENALERARATSDPVQLRQESWARQVRPAECAEARARKWCVHARPTPALRARSIRGFLEQDWALLFFLFQTDRLFLIVDKPLTKMMPELVEDNDEFILNKKLIPSGNYQIKRGSTKKNENKKDILTEHFHL